VIYSGSGKKSQRLLTGITGFEFGINQMDGAKGSDVCLIRKPETPNEWNEFEAAAMPYMEDVYRVAMWLVRDRDEAEDLVQETFFQALQSFHRFEKGTNCRAWLITILYHTNSKRIRKHSRLQLVHDAEQEIAERITFEPQTPHGLTDEDVLIAIKKIPRQFQEVVLLCDVEELSYKEIAKTLNLPIGTVMSRLHRGRKLLRTELATYANQYGINRNKMEDKGRRSNAMP
jgi:RNA polymerase sigma-70 factor (ECF subfamily)